ncbi:MAG TPA: PIG-L deacetylase family protein [Acidimicrobiia bacterium]|jgi:LmbE family N-acetylglucosaminyl deacetylase|nr:PIG-L deacetylase family protein [Acidimicrobiia bacterium]
MTIRFDLPVPRRVLAIGAHSDDIEFGCAATLAKWSDAGAEVHLLVCTDGSKGTWDPRADLTALVARREDEQRDAAKILGAIDVRFLRRIDGELVNDLATRAEVCAAIREVKPDVVLGHDPWQAYRLHPDHLEAGRLAVDGIVAARDPHFFTDQDLAPHRPQTLLLFEAARVEHLERVEGYLDRKVASLLAHRSQWRSTMGIDAAPDTEQAAFVAGVHEAAQTAGLRGGFRAAEAYARIDGL